MKSKSFFTVLLIIFLFSCKNQKLNYIKYYNKVNEADSIYRMAKNPQKAIKKYRKIFRKYPPKNQERIEEYATYITISDYNGKNFGSKKSLYKLISLIAPYGNKYNEYLPLFKKYNIDSIEVKQEIAKWKKKLDTKLIDSFSIAMIRD